MLTADLILEPQFLVVHGNWQDSTQELQKVWTKLTNGVRYHGGKCNGLGASNAGSTFNVHGLKGMQHEMACDGKCEW